jgi:predicted nucleotidyltransferase
MQTDMHAIIQEKLKAIEQEHDVKILFACESGSRAWGFASPDSDYDVRFIYACRRDHYLSVDDQRDVIEQPINDVLDISGWELRKALKLFRKSNPPLYEWLQSHIVYQADAQFLEAIQKLMPAYFLKRASMHHYLSMASSVWHNDLATPEVKLKKYFYVLRPLLACRWIADRSEVPPMELNKLRVLLSDDLHPVLDTLLLQKAEVTEKFMIGHIAALDHFFEEQLSYCQQVVPEASSVFIDNEPLNQLFRKFIA